MPRILRRPLAGADIDDLWDYIAEDNVAQADAWIDRLDGKLRLPATQPMMGRARDELSPGLRSMPFGRYVIFYVPLPPSRGGSEFAPCETASGRTKQRARCGHEPSLTIAGLLLADRRIDS